MRQNFIKKIVELKYKLSTHSRRKMRKSVRYLIFHSLPNEVRNCVGVKTLMLKVMVSIGKASKHSWKYTKICFIFVANGAYVNDGRFVCARRCVLHKKKPLMWCSYNDTITVTITSNTCIHGEHMYGVSGWSIYHIYQVTWALGIAADMREEWKE